MSLLGDARACLRARASLCLRLRLLRQQSSEMDADIAMGIDVEMDVNHAANADANEAAKSKANMKMNMEMETKERGGHQAGVGPSAGGVQEIPHTTEPLLAHQDCPREEL